MVFYGDASLDARKFDSHGPETILAESADTDMIKGLVVFYHLREDTAPRTSFNKSQTAKSDVCQALLEAPSIARRPSAEIAILESLSPTSYESRQKCR